MASQMRGDSKDLINATDIIVTYYEKYQVKLGFHLMLQPKINYRSVKEKL